MRKVFLCGVVLLVFGSLFAEARSKHERPWVGTWSCAPQKVEVQNLPPSPGLQGNLLRQVVHITEGGDELKINISKELLLVVASNSVVSRGNRPRERSHYFVRRQAFSEDSSQRVHVLRPYTVRGSALLRFGGDDQSGRSSKRHYRPPWLASDLLCGDR